MARVQLTLNQLDQDGKELNQDGKDNLYVSILIIWLIIKSGIRLNLGCILCFPDPHNLCAPLGKLGS